MKKRLKIMTVCGFGLGTSLVLKMTLDEVLEESGIIAETFCADVDTAPGHAYDLVVTSQDLEARFASRPEPVVVVNDFLSAEEVREKVIPAVKKIISA